MSLNVGGDVTGFLWSPTVMNISLSDVSVCLLKASGKNLNLNDESQHGLLMQLLKLSYNCLNYDFIGTSTDESSDDLCTVQIPTSWRSGVYIQDSWRPHDVSDSTCATPAI